MTGLSGQGDNFAETGGDLPWPALRAANGIIGTDAPRARRRVPAPIGPDYSACAPHSPETRPCAAAASSPSRRLSHRDLHARRARVALHVHLESNPPGDDHQNHRRRLRRARRRRLARLVDGHLKLEVAGVRSALTGETHLYWFLSRPSCGLSVKATTFLRLGGLAEPLRGRTDLAQRGLSSAQDEAVAAQPRS